MPGAGSLAYFDSFMKTVSNMNEAIIAEKQRTDDPTIALRNKQAAQRRQQQLARELAELRKLEVTKAKAVGQDYSSGMKTQRTAMLTADRQRAKTQTDASKTSSDVKKKIDSVTSEDFIKNLHKSLKEDLPNSGFDNAMSDTKLRGAIYDFIKGQDGSTDEQINARKRQVEIAIGKAIAKQLEVQADPEGKNPGIELKYQNQPIGAIPQKALTELVMRQYGFGGQEANPSAVKDFKSRIETDAERLVFEASKSGRIGVPSPSLSESQKRQEEIFAVPTAETKARIEQIQKEIKDLDTEIDLYDAKIKEGPTSRADIYAQAGVTSPMMQTLNIQDDLRRRKLRPDINIDEQIAGLMRDRDTSYDPEFEPPTPQPFAGDFELDEFDASGRTVPFEQGFGRGRGYLKNVMSEPQEPLALDEFDASGRTVPFKEGFGRGRGYLKNVMSEPQATEEEIEFLPSEVKRVEDPFLLDDFDASGRTVPFEQGFGRGQGYLKNVMSEPQPRDQKADGLFPEGRTMPLLLPEFDARGRTATRKPPSRQAFPSPLDAYRDPEPRSFLGDDEDFDIYGLQGSPEYSRMQSKSQLIQDIMDFQDFTGRQITPKEQLQRFDYDQLKSLDEQLRLIQRGYTSEMLQKGFRAETRMDVESQIKVNGLDLNDFDLLRDNNGDFIAVPKGTSVNMNRFTKVPFLSTPKDINIPSLRESRR